MRLSLVFIVMSAFFALSTPYPYAQPNLIEWSQDQVRVRREGGGGWNIDVDHDRGGGTRLRGEVNRRFESDNGKIRGVIRGHIDRTYGGPNDGTRSRGIGLSIGGDWR